jgi:putative toxin-antitoxin system antitoxin component (TIGR02293 family)
MAKKAATKKSTQRSERQRYYGKTTRNAIRDLKARETTAVTTGFSTGASMIDMLSGRGVIHKNKAAGLKIKLAEKVNAVMYLGDKNDLPPKAQFESETDYIQLIRKGVSKKSIDHLIEATSITAAEMAELMETTPRKLAAIKPNTIMEKSQSEKAVNIARLYSLGEEVFGSKEEFNKWMNGRVPSLGKQMPKEYLDTASGINLLMDELGRIQHGVYS